MQSKYDIITSDPRSQEGWRNKNRERGANLTRAGIQLSRVSAFSDEIPSAASTGRAAMTVPPYPAQSPV
jgi:hypothetical protein